MIDAAREVCIRQHDGQLDKCGKPYYLHPFRVADRLEGETEKAVAYLHDTVEDTDIGLDDLRMLGFPEDVVGAVDSLTRRDGEDYFDYIVNVE